MITRIEDLWEPQQWIQGVAERVAARPSLINSGILARPPGVSKAASGPGTNVNIPYLIEPDYDDEIQVENTGPTINNLTSGNCVCTVLNRVSAVGRTALSKAASGVDVMGAVFGYIADMRLRQRQKTLLSVLRGVFGNTSGPNDGSAALKALRKDYFLEAGENPELSRLFSKTIFRKSIEDFGETKNVLEGSVIVCHSDIETSMLLMDDIETVRDSEGKMRVQRYKKCRVFVSDLLVRPGALGGKVYDTYLIRPGAVAFGEKPQSNEVGDVASLIYTGKSNTNNVVLYDRTRFIMHPYGVTWKGNPAVNSAHNNELAVEANWGCAQSNIKNAMIICIRTNG